MKAQLLGTLKFRNFYSVIANATVPVGPTDSNPGTLGVKIINDAKGWLLLIVGAYAAVQFILGAMDFMSKEPQKHSSGKDHMVHACVGLVLAFTATSIMTYLQTQSGTWTVAGPALQQALILAESTRTL